MLKKWQQPAFSLFLGVEYVNTTELMMRVTRPDGSPATIDQLRHARLKRLVDAPDGGWNERHIAQLQEYVDQATPGRKRKAVACD